MTAVPAAPPGGGQPLGSRQIAWRIFFTAWIVYAIHFTTDVVREHYPAIALGDRLSFNLEGFCGLHPDLFELPGRGCFIGNNPGISMFAAIPYVIASPVINRITDGVQAKRLASGQTEPPAYYTTSPNTRRFYAEAWRRGLDVKLVLAALVMQVFFMAPGSALAVVLVFLTLQSVLPNRRAALWLSLLYAFGTPVFYRTGFLNHNLMLGHIAFAGMALVWNPWGGTRLSNRARDILCGVAGGLALLFDYTGVVIIAGLGLYVTIKRWMADSPAAGIRAGAWYTLGALGPIGLLWFYQYAAFGNPFLPGQHWMPPVQWIDRGYQGYQFPPSGELLWMLLMDHRFGLFVSGPVFLLALAAPFVNRGEGRLIPRMELAVMFGLVIGTWLFFGGNNYTRLQFNTGIRYLACLFPFLFIPAALVLSRMRLATAYSWALLGISIAWPLAMYRRVQSPIGVLDPIVRTFSAGFTLPSLRSLSLTSGQYGDYFLRGVSPLAVYVLAAAIIWAIWSPRFRSDQGRD